MAALGVAAKTAAVLAKDGGKIGKKAVGIIGGILFFAVLLIISLLSLVSSFIPDGVLFRPEDTEVWNTAIYKSVDDVTANYFASIKEQMEQEKQNLINDNTVEEITTDETGKEIHVKKCDVTITQTFNYFGTAYLVAYLQYTDNLDVETAEINNEAAKNFLSRIGTITVSKISEKEYEITNTYLTGEEIAEKYFETKAEKTRFLASSRAYGSYFGVEEAEVKKDVINTYELLQGTTFLEIPLYLQYSGAWASMPYGNGTIAQKGCSPTCLAMVLSYLKQQEILPNDITAWTGNRYYVLGAGSSWSIFPAVAEQWGVKCTNLGTNVTSMVQALQNGKPVISSMCPGTFTKGGHFIVLTGITEDGRITVNDPNDNNIKDFKNKSFELSLITRESKNFWCFE